MFKAYSKFQKVGRLTIICVYLLFLLGGLVRATGSGMGCPDWPKCFGKLIPPTCECQLEPGYKEVFLKKRLTKVDRMVKTLQAFGMTEKAQAIAENKQILEPEAFNAAKAWIEYVNRIFGVLSGFFGLAMFFLSFKFLKSNRKVFVWTSVGFLLLLVNAWLGSIVVATNLLPGIVSIHYLAAFLCIFAFIKAIHVDRDFNDILDFQSIPSGLIYGFFALIFGTVLLGTYSREIADILNSKNQLVFEGELNYSGMGLGFIVHRYMPLVLLGIAIYLYRSIRASGQKSKLLVLSIVFIAFQIILGVINIKWVLPPWSQTLHIFFGSTLPVILFIFVLTFTQWRNRKLNL